MMKQIGTSPRKWREVLNTTYNEVLRLCAHDVLVFGSQAMSIYMERALASKDLDLIASGLTLNTVTKLSQKLAPYSGGKAPEFAFMNYEYDDRPNPVFSIYLKPKDDKPFVVELLQTYLGHDVTKLTPFVVFKNRWKQKFQTLSVEAIIATRLAYRPPERISPLNASRLNRLIRANRANIHWRKVTKFVKVFQMEQRIAENLKKLNKIHNIDILDSDKLRFLSS